MVCQCSPLQETMCGHLVSGVSKKGNLVYSEFV